MWLLNEPWYDSVIRGAVFYVFLFFLSRILGKKQLTKLSTFELVLLTATTHLLLNSLIKNDLTFITAAMTIATFIAFHILISRLVLYFPKLAKFVEGQPVVVILNGRMFKKVMRKEKITETELFEALREHEVMNPEDVKCAILETDGKISVIKYEH